MVIETLKQAPTFGIHGCKYENLESVLSGEGSPWGKGRDFAGHYFLVGEEEKELPDHEFRERLEESVHNALGFSFYNLSYIGRGDFYMERNPCLVILVEKAEGAVENKRKRAIFGEDRTFNGHFFGPETFPITEDAVREFVDLKPIIINSEDLKRITSAFESYMRRKGLSSDSFGIGIIAEYFALRHIVKLAVKRISEKLRPYVKPTGKTQPNQQDIQQ